MASGKAPERAARPPASKAKGTRKTKTPDAAAPAPGSADPETLASETPNEAETKAPTTAPDPNMTPLDYLLRILRDESQPQSARVEAAKAAAPFLHPRLAQVAHGGAVQLAHEQALDELE